MKDDTSTTIVNLREINKITQQDTLFYWDKNKTKQNKRGHQSNLLLI